MMVLVVCGMLVGNFLFWKNSLSLSVSIYKLTVLCWFSNFLSLVNVGLVSKGFLADKFFLDSDTLAITLGD